MRTLIRWVLPSILVLCVLLQAGDAMASPQGTGLHKKALEAFNDGDYKKAKRLWVQAYTLDREPKYLYNLARMAQEMDHPIEVIRYFEQFLQNAPKTPKYKKLIKNARVHLGNMLKRVGTLRIIAPQTGAQVVVAGKLLGAGPLNTQLRLKAGKHVVAVTLRGHHGETRTIDLAGGDRRTLRIKLKKIKARVIIKRGKLKTPLPRWLPWTGLVLGLGIAGGGAGAMVVAQNAYNKYDDSIPSGNYDTDAYDKGVLYRKIGVGLIVVGGVVAGVSFIGLLLNRPRLVKSDDGDADTKKASLSRPSRPQLMVVPVIGRTTGVAVTYRF